MSAAPAPSAQLAVEVRNLHVSYEQDGQVVQALRGVRLAVGAGESVAVVGPSGSGKSSLLGVLAALAPPAEGTVRIFGAAPGHGSPTEVGVMLQNPARNLFALATATQNLVLVARAAGASRPAARGLAANLLAAVGLTPSGAKRVRELSGGEQQRLALAVALITRPRLLLADEPTSQLDRTSGMHVAQLLQEAHRGDGMALVVVTHDDAVAGLFDRTIEIRDGLLSGVHR